nr:hypothetical protein [Elizabethkingia sp. ASV34]
MGNKNINAGTVQTSSGNIHIGDNINKIYFEGIPVLLLEYKNQLEIIKKFLDEFKIKSALLLINNLEIKVNDHFTNDLQNKNLLLGKIFFLKALALRELEIGNAQEAAKLFISAYKKQTSDSLFRDRACIEYLNLQENNQALKLADQIIKDDEFNLNAWFVKTLSAKDIKSYLNTVPSSVKNNKDFNLSLIFQLIKSQNFKHFDEIEEFGLKYDYKENDFGELTFDNKNSWEIGVDLLLNKFFSDFPVRYIAGESPIYDDEKRITQVIQKLEHYHNVLKDTELNQNLKFHDIYYYYFRYVLHNHKLDSINLINLYTSLDSKPWPFIIFICQVLNHQKDYKQALEFLQNFKNDNEKNTELIQFEAALLKLNNQPQEIYNLIFKYIDQIEIISEIELHNIFHFLPLVIPETEIKLYFSKIKAYISQKEFITHELKELSELVIDVRFLEDYNDEEARIKTLQLSKIKSFDETTKLVIAKTLEILGERTEAILLIESFVDKNKISDGLRIYIMLLINHLYDENIVEKGLSRKTIKLLKFWRYNSKIRNIYFLEVEHDLYMNISDFNALIEVDTLLLEIFPEKEKYLYAVLLDYEKLGKIEELKEFINNLKETFQEEYYGIEIVKLLVRQEINKEKAFKILFNLASNPMNHESRKAYFILSHNFSEYLYHYEIATTNCWVEFIINGSTNIIKLTKDNEYHNQLIGKKIGDIINIERKLSKKNIKIKITELYNDGVNLMNKIIPDLYNPMNNFGFESHNFNSGDPEDMQKTLIELFGEDGTKQKEYRKKQLSKYYVSLIGFSEISFSIFHSSFLDAYIYLTTNPECYFTTFPNNITQDIEENTTFSIDLTTLLLFYFLDKELKFEYKHKFIVPTTLIEEIEMELSKEKNERESKLTIDITTEGVHPYYMPENFKQQRIEFLQSVLTWTNNHCIIDYVKEKNDYLPKFRFNQSNKLNVDNVRILLDTLLLSQRKHNRSISSDSTIFLMNVNKKDIYENFLNPEKYLIYFYKEKCNNTFYRYLLKHNYLGISISIELLLNEFEDYVKSKENYYLKALENIQYYVHCNNKQYDETIILFISHIYSRPDLELKSKNIYVFDILRNYLFGMPKEKIDIFHYSILLYFTEKTIQYKDNLNIQLSIVRFALLRK